MLSFWLASMVRRVVVHVKPAEHGALPTFLANVVTGGAVAAAASLVMYPLDFARVRLAADVKVRVALRAGIGPGTSLCMGAHGLVGWLGGLPAGWAVARAAHCVLGLYDVVRSVHHRHVPGSLAPTHKPPPGGQ